MPEAAAGAGAFGGGGGLFGLLGGAALGGLGGILGERNARKARRRQRQALGEARQFADETVARITGGELFSSAQEFLTSTFRDAGTSPLAQDAAKQIRAAQSVRGTFAGNIGAVAEGFGTSAAAQRLRSSLLPQALTFALAPEQLRQSVLGFEAPLRVAAATGGQLAGVGPSNIQSPFSSFAGQALQGALGGFQIGSAIQSQRTQSQRLALQQQQLEQQLGSGANNSFFSQFTGGLQSLGFRGLV